tara:strand:- start:4804 stop:5946 length:1143 start_codon:yes stop_codon:yes gene_type:complete
VGCSAFDRGFSASWEASTSSSTEPKDAVIDVQGAKERARARATMLKDKALAAQVRAMMVFDRDLVRAHRDRAAFLQQRALKARPEHAPDDLLDELARRLLDRLFDIKRDFKRIVVLGGANEAITRRLLAERDDIEKIVVVDLSQDMLDFVESVIGAEPKRRDGTPVEISYVQGDEENLPIQMNSVDAVISCLGLHWVNDLPGAMSSAAATLVPDGLFLSSIFGGNTLQELRVACALAETEHEGGVSARVSPLAHVRDCGSLLGRANLSLPAVDVDIVTMGYGSPEKLVEHLRAMGETNAGLMRRPFLPRETAVAARTLYAEKFPAPRTPGSDNAEGAVEATFEVLYMTGWRSHESQQSAKQRGSATVSLADLQKHLDGEK